MSDKQCPICTNKVDHRRRCCSHHCDSELRYRKYISEWLSGEQTGIKGFGVSTYIRRWMVEQYGEQCSKCGWSEINKNTQRIPVQVNHIDGNWKNNNPNNLEFLCPNCHSLTPNFGGANRGNGRKERKNIQDYL